MDKKQENVEKKRQEAINETIDFFDRNFLAFDIFTGRIIEEELKKEALEKFQRLKKILGNDVVEYIISKKMGSISGSLPKELIEKEEVERQKEYARIRGLTREELIQEAERDAAQMRKEDEEIKKMEEEADRLDEEAKKDETP